MDAKRAALLGAAIWAAAASCGWRSCMAMSSFWGGNVTPRCDWPVGAVADALRCKLLAAVAC